ncbi:hypothetical protein N356_gp032 [Cellulophaga phage phi14:2]|uniref:Uncharacterized protein n=1 Tax=Cellulophaga phage phi14:2 TaxID=1327990 RepID=S0A011_9CAUD|nr:hypothetical protein N356_gp032 [Cellulophaga phage phi14:2]AGO48924.1 hypothetical protein Phi14:2_gp046 [Cellulophaga phage phi14:2]
MSKINLNSFVQEDKEVVVFNNGTAGRVKGVTVSVSKKKPEDSANSPDFKIFTTDSNGGSVNLGIYYPTERTKDSEIKIRYNQMVSLLFALNPSLRDKALPEFENNRQGYDFLIQEIAKNSKASLINVFVSYGIRKKPETYLSFRAYNIFEAGNTSDETTRLKVVRKDNEYDDVMTRPEATNFDSQQELDPFSQNEIPQSPSAPVEGSADLGSKDTTDWSNLS